MVHTESMIGLNLLGLLCYRDRMRTLVNATTRMMCIAVTDKVCRGHMDKIHQGQTDTTLEHLEMCLSERKTDVDQEVNLLASV